MIAPWKKDFVTEFASLINEYPVVGIVNLANLPSPALAEIRKKFRGMFVVQSGRVNLMIRAIKESKKPGISELEKHLVGQPAFIFSKDNAFKLYKTVQKNKSAAPAKAGQPAPRDIIIPAVNTGFAPGPINSELGMLGLKVGVEAGKVVIKEEKLIAKEGQIITAQMASTFAKLGILPMEIGMNITVLTEGGTLFDKKSMHVDEKALLADIVGMHLGAMNLCLNVGILMPETTQLLIGKVHQDVLALCRGKEIMIPELAGDTLAKVEHGAQTVMESAEHHTPKS